MSKPIKYNVLLFDDDPVFLDSLEAEIYSCTSSADYDIYIKKTTSSRYALEFAESTLFDVFILDVCNRQWSDKPTDMYDYQGQDLYNNLLDKHPKLQYVSKFIILSNLKPDIAKLIFGYKDAEYLYKQESNCKNTALYLKFYFDAHYKQNYDNSKSCNNAYDICIKDINAENIQINIANNNSEISSTQENEKTLEVEKLVRNIQHNIPNTISLTEQKKIKECLEQILLEMKKEKPRRKVISAVVNSLKGIKGTVEFAAAVAELISFISSFM